jgi:hypothetical protein
VETRSIVEAFDEGEEGGPSGLSGLEGFILHQLGGYSLLQSALVEPRGGELAIELGAREGVLAVRHPGERPLVRLGLPWRRIRQAIRRRPTAKPLSCGSRGELIRGVHQHGGGPN